MLRASGKTCDQILVAIFSRMSFIYLKNEA